MDIRSFFLRLLLSLPVDVGQNLLCNNLFIRALSRIIQCETEIFLNTFSPVNDSLHDHVECVVGYIDDCGITINRDEDTTIISFPAMLHECDR